MAHCAYASLWCRNFSEETMLERFGQFLETVPFSRQEPGFTSLVIRPLGPAEAPLLEQGLRPVPQGATSLISLAREFLHGDSAYETRAHWDLWNYNLATARWELIPQPLDICCFGEEYDDETWQQSGHILVDAGFEHLFTGHAGLLGFGKRSPAAPQHPDEAAFLTTMTAPQNLRNYQEKTRENIRQLYAWMQRIESEMPLERYRLWSEGEENFEARLDEIFAAS